MTRLSRLSTLAIGLLLTPLVALAQAFPSKPIHIVVPFPAGGAGDTLNRSIAAKLAENIGKPVLVDNRPGASTIIGAEAVAKAAPDGHTLLFATDVTTSINPLVYRKLPYNPQTDFAPVTAIAYVPIYLLVNAEVGANSIADLIRIAKANPGKLNFASFGMATNAHLDGEALQRAAGINMVHVPFKGVAEVVPALLSGQVQVVLTSPNQSLPHIRTGRIKALGIMRRERSALMPEVPTFAEAGLKDMDSSPWYGFVVPARTPQDIVQKLAAELGKVLTDPDFREKSIVSKVMEPAPVGPEHLAGILRSDREKYARYIKALNIKLD